MAKLLVMVSQKLPDFDMDSATEAEMEAGMEALADGISASLEIRQAVEGILHHGGLVTGPPEVSENEGEDVILSLIYDLPPPDKTVDVAIKHLRKFFQENRPEIKGVEFKAI